MSKISNFNGLEDILKILFMNIRIRFLSSEQDLMNGELTNLVGINVGNHNWVKHKCYKSIKLLKKIQWKGIMKIWML